MVLWFYSLVVWLAQPLLRRKLARRGVLEPGYLKNIEERFGHYHRSLDSVLDTRAAEGQTQQARSTFQDGKYVWIHAVSLGETRAAAALIAALRTAMPGMRLLLTHGTATGRAEGEKLLQPGDVQVWQPWDARGAVKRFLRHFEPAAGVLMETEVWPNLVAQCLAHGVPLVLANARLNAESFTRARKLGWLSRPTYGSLAAVLAQSDDDAARLRQMGAPVRGVFGNLKFDATPNGKHLALGREWRAALNRPVVMLASSRDGEEQQLVQILKELKALAGAASIDSAINKIAKSTATPALPCAQWLVVPRHPQRFEDVIRLLQRSGFTVSRRSGWGSGPPVAADIWVGDSLGEMALYYGMADVALLGGSFTPVGGQNLIEAASCGCPLIMGPSVFNFAEAALLAEAAGAARTASNLQNAVSQAVLLGNDGAGRAAMAAAAEEFAQAHRGAAERTAKAVAEACRLP